MGVDSARLEFKGEEFLVTVTVEAEDVVIAVQRAADGAAWRQTFPPAYLEEVTQRAGNAKSAALFYEMLRSSLRGASSSCSLDLLTGADLEVLKRRGAAPESAHSLAAARASPLGKRYLILTYSAAYDRVHYPLPLLPAEGGWRSGPEAAAELARENSALLRSENAALRAQLGQRSNGSSDPVTRLSAMEAALERARAGAAAARAEHAAEVAALQASLAAARDAERSWRVRARDARAEVESLQRRLRATEARVGLRGAAASANFTYTRASSRPSSSAGGSRPASPAAFAPPSRAGSRGASPAPSRGPPSPAVSAYAPARRASTPSRRPTPPPQRPFDPGAWAAERAAKMAAAPSARGAFGTSASRSSTPGPGSRPASPAHGRRASSPARAQSPSAALRDVKARLAEFTRAGAAGIRPPTPPPTRSAAPLDSSAAIADIDARLHALQAFLRAAKTSSAAA